MGSETVVVSLLARCEARWRPIQMMAKMVKRTPIAMPGITPTRMAATGNLSQWRFVGIRDGFNVDISRGASVDEGKARDDVVKELDLVNEVVGEAVDVNVDVDEDELKVVVDEAVGVDVDVDVDVDGDELKVVVDEAVGEEDIEMVDGRVVSFRMHWLDWHV